MIRVLLADDQPLVRTGFRMILDAEPDMEVVGEAGDGADAVRQVRRLLPGVVVMDIRMPVQDGITATSQITAEGGARVLVLTTFHLDEDVVNALRAGASGFLLKDAPPADLLAAIRTVAGGAAVLAPSTTRRLIDRFVPLLPDPERTTRRDSLLKALTGREAEVFRLLDRFAHRLPASAREGSRRPAGAPSADRLTGITERETQVLTLVARGLSNVEISAELVVTETTVKTHVHHLLTKLAARDRVQLVILAYDAGLAGQQSPS